MSTLSALLVLVLVLIISLVVVLVIITENFFFNMSALISILMYNMLFLV